MHIKETFFRQKVYHYFKSIKVTKNIFAAQVDQSILKVGVNLFGKVTTIRVVMNRRRPPISK